MPAGQGGTAGVGPSVPIGTAADGADVAAEASTFAARLQAGATSDQAAASGPGPAGQTRTSVVIPLGHRRPLAAVSGPWGGLSVKAARHLTVPILFGVAVALFLILQALVDRRDPKVSRAPERGDDETIGFS